MSDDEILHEEDVREVIEDVVSEHAFDYLTATVEGASVSPDGYTRVEGWAVDKAGGSAITLQQGIYFNLEAGLYQFQMRMQVTGSGDATWALPSINSVVGNENIVLGGNPGELNVPYLFPPGSPTGTTLVRWTLGLVGPAQFAIETARDGVAADDVSAWIDVVRLGVLAPAV